MSLESNRRDLLKTGAAIGVAGAAGGVFAEATQPAVGQPAAGAKAATKIVKNVCHQCPARCGIDVYITDGKVHAIYGSLTHRSSNGKLCPKGHLGQYILYDPDRIKGPMKRTNPKKGRNEDPKFAPISWDEALNTLAARLEALRAKNEQHRFGILTGRGWGQSDTGVSAMFGRLYGTPNVGLGHSSMCSDASKKAKLALDGNYDYNAYDYLNTNYLLNLGAAYQPASAGRNEMFLEMHPTAAKARGIRNGDRVKISSTLGAIYSRVHVTPAARPDTVVVPFGFGHWGQGRWAKGRGASVSEIIPNVSDPISGLTSNYSVKVRVEKA